VLGESAPAVVLGAEVRSDLVLTPGVGASCAGQETGQGIAATRPRFLGSAVLIEDLYSLGDSDLVPVHLVLAPLTAELEFVPALHVSKSRQQVVDLVAVLINRPGLGAERFARRLRVPAADVHDGRRDGPGAGYVGGKAQIFDRIKAGVVLGDSLRVREPTGETNRHVEKRAGAES